MPTIAVDGAELHIEEVGGGPVALALVLHGGLGVDDHQMCRGLDLLGEHLRRRPRPPRERTVDG